MYINVNDGKEEEIEISRVPVKHGLNTSCTIIPHEFHLDKSFIITISSPNLFHKFKPSFPANSSPH